MSKAEKILKCWSELQGVKDRLDAAREFSRCHEAHADVLKALVHLNRAIEACRRDYEEATRPVAALAAIHRHGHRAEG